MTFQEFQPVLVWIGLYLKLFAFMLVRPLFFCYFFMPFSSVFGRGMVLRFVISASFVFPVFIAFEKQILEVGNGSLFDQWVFIGGEAFIGVVLGMLLSIPFWAAKLSGGVIDIYRGESNSEHQDESGELLTTTSKLIFAVTVVVFAANDGFILLYQSLYSTYVIWPIRDAFTFNGFGNVSGVLQLADAIFRMILFVTLPLIILLLSVEFSASFFDNMLQRAKISNLAQIFKSLAYLILLPVYMYFLIYLIQGELSKYFNFLQFIEALGK